MPNVAPHGVSPDGMPLNPMIGPTPCEKIPPGSTCVPDADNEGFSILGIWRTGKTLRAARAATLSLAQPADAPSSPRWDYVIKRVTQTSKPQEGRRQIVQFIAAAGEARHPNLVPVLDASATASTPYVVMPRLEGKTMQDHLEEDPGKPLPVALWLIRQTAQALQALHAAGWIHCDVHPTNVMIGTRGHVTLLDLGFATRVHTTPEHQYRTSQAYAAPETLKANMAAIPETDIFSLGRMLWQWITQTRQVQQALLEPVADLVKTMVAIEPNERPTAGEVVRTLLQLEIETLGQHIGPGQTRRVA